MTFRLDHVGLPFNRTQGIGRIADFWAAFDLQVMPYAYSDPRVDHAGTAQRYRVCAGQQMLFGYYETDVPELEIRRAMELFGHIGIEVEPSLLEQLFSHDSFKHATRWGPGYLSVFVTGPYGLRLEFLARNALVSEAELPHTIIHAA